MSKVSITRSLLDDLAVSISTKSGEPVPMTLTEMKDAVDSIQTGGGDEYIRTIIAPQQTASPSSAMEQITLTSSGLIEDAKDYIVTLDGVEWLTTCETLWSSNYCIGEVRYFLEASPSSTIYPFGAICEGGIIYACFATTGSHTIKIERIDLLTGGTTLTTKSITANGTYNASSDSADGYSQVTVSVSGGTPRTSTDLTVSGATVTAPAGVYATDASKSVASGTAGTPTATKGTVSNHSISVTPSVTNTTGYITGSTKTGTAVTVSASELVSGSETKTENGTYDVTNLASLVVNVPSGSSKNAQVVQGTTRTTSSTLTAIGAELTVSKTGTYDVYWSGVRTTTSGSYTYGTQLYVDGTAYGTQNTTWSNHVQNNHLTGVSLTANQKIRVYGRNSRGSSYYIYAPTLVIIEA